MLKPLSIIKTPWDQKALGLDTYEIKKATARTIRQALKIPGHYTVRVTPSFDSKILHAHGFYYCGTLITPYCQRKNFVFYAHPAVAVKTAVSLSKFLKMIPGAFSEYRFHRDFNVDPRKADLRYVQWFKQLVRSKNMFVFTFKGEAAGFFGYSKSKILLHALSPKFRGRGLAKYFWSLACRRLFEAGADELKSSISASNLAAVNLYASLGFRFKDPLDVYHTLVGHADPV